MTLIYHMNSLLILLFAACAGIGLLIRNKKDLQKKINVLNERIENQEGKTDLELATVHQIISELVKRPNYRFMFIVPHLDQAEDRQTLNVEIHSSNVSVRMALDILRTTYQGVVETLKRNNPNEDIEEL